MKTHLEHVIDEVSIVFSGIKKRVFKRRKVVCVIGSISLSTGALSVAGIQA